MHFNLFLGVILICFTPLFAKVPNDLSFFEDKPRSIAKDYYIYRYLQKNSTTSSEAWKLLEMSQHMSLKLFHAFASRIDDPNFKKTSKCLKMKLGELLKQDDECLAIGFDLYDATKLNTKTLKSIEKRLIETIGDTGKKLHTARSRNDQVAVDFRKWTLKRNKEIVKESTVKGLNYTGLNEGEMEIAC